VSERERARASGERASVSERELERAGASGSERERASECELGLCKQVGCCDMAALAPSTRAEWRGGCERVALTQSTGVGGEAAAGGWRLTHSTR